LAELTRPLKKFKEEHEAIQQLTIIITKLESFLNKITETISFSESILKLLDLSKHYHKCHKHGGLHDVSIIDESGNGESFSISRINPKIEFMSLELYVKQDLTQNSSIYGTNYFFKNSSKMTPPGYRVINAALKTETVGVPQISWDSYKSYVLSSILKCSSSFAASGGSSEDSSKIEIKFIQDSILNDSNNSSNLNISKIFILETKYNIDLDNNNLIYGVDFIIPEINENNEYLRIITSDIPDIEQLSLDSYLKSIKIIPEDKIMLDVPNILEPELIPILIQEFQTGIDVDGDGYIYGKDILIFDPPAPLSQYIPPFIPITIISWNAFKQYYNIFLESTNNSRDIEDYVQILNNECSSQTDLDFNGLIYNVNFIISDDKYKPKTLQCNENQSLSKISFLEYIETLPFNILKNNTDSGIICVRLAHEFSKREELIDIDNNGIINGIDFIVNDYDSNKFTSLIDLEKSSMFSTNRSNLNYIKCKYFSNINIVPNYTQLEFNNYWTSISGMQDPILVNDVQNDSGATIENNQIVSICCPVWVSKTGFLPAFIPILSLYDIETMVSNQENKSLTITKVGNGYIDSNPDIIGCGCICTCQLPYNSRISLFAYSSYGYEFISWSGFDTCDIISESNAEECSLIMFNDKIITCTFSLKKYIIKINKLSGDGVISDSINNISCGTGCGVGFSQEYLITHGTEINLNIVANAGYEFIEWTGADTIFNTTASLTMLSDKTITANFISVFSLSVNVITDPNITIDAYYLNVKQPSSLLYYFRENSEIVLYISPSAPYKLDNFDGVDTSFGNRCTVNMTSNKTITIHLSLKTFYLTIIKSGGTGRISDTTGIINCGTICKSIISYGQLITLMVFPDSGYEFINWEGSDNDSSLSECQVNMTSNKTITVNFRAL